MELIIPFVSAAFRTGRFLGPGLLVFLSLSSPALAHRISVFAYGNAETIHVEGYAGSGTPCRDAQVEVRDAEGTLLLELRTDGKGQCSFPNPGKGDLRIVLRAGPGHRAEYVLPASEQSEPVSPAPKPPPAGPEDLSPSPAPSEAPLRDLDGEITALRREIARLQEERKGVTVEKVLAGLALLLSLTALGWVAALARRRGGDHRGQGKELRVDD